MTGAVTIRPATLDDLGAVDLLLGQSYPRLLAPDYPPSVLVTVLPLMVRAQPSLLTSGSYFLAEIDGHVLAAGGYTWQAPTGGMRKGVAHLRHVVTDKDHVRRGLGRRLIAHAMDHAQDRGAWMFDCISTRTAQPFYAALGFRKVADTVLKFCPGIDFAAVHMQRRVAR